MKWLVLLALVAVLGCMVLFINRFSRAKGPSNPTEPDQNSEDPSLYERIRAQTAKSPDKPLDYDGFPPIHPNEAGISFSPGTMDAILGRSSGEKGDDWKKISNAIREINAGNIANWRELERSIKGVDTAAHVDTVLENLNDSDVTPIVKKLFWETARRSHDYETVKWGVAIGGVFLTKEEIPDLLILARHGEFTLYSSHVLLRESERHPEYKEHLVSLLPVSRQWAVIRLIDYIVRDKELIYKPANQEKVLVHGMENNDGIPMEVAFTIASSIDVSAFMKKAERDERVFSAVAALFDSLMLEPQPLGGIRDLENGRSLFAQFFDLIGKHKADIKVLWAFRSIELFLDDKKLDWDSREQLLQRTRNLYSERLSSEILRDGLRKDAERWLALQIIEERKLHDLLPDVLEAFNRKPDTKAIDVLGALGDNSHLDLMMRKIPDIVNLEERRKHPFSSVNVHGPEYMKNMEYGSIVSHLGRLATPEAIVHIKQAANDYDPHIRCSAMQAIVDLPAERIDTELRALVQNRLSDSPPYVVASAKKAAEKLGIPLPKEEEKKPEQ